MLPLVTLHNPPFQANVYGLSYEAVYDTLEEQNISLYGELNASVTGLCWFIFLNAFLYVSGCRNTCVK
jgi:hypothetical protein